MDSQDPNVIKKPQGFQPGNPGRRKGSKNKTPLESYMSSRQATPRPEVLKKVDQFDSIIFGGALDAFERLGGVAGMVTYGRKHPDQFYRFLATLLGKANILKNAKTTANVNVQVANFDE